MDSADNGLPILISCSGRRSISYPQPLDVLSGATGSMDAIWVVGRRAELFPLHGVLGKFHHSSNFSFIPFLSLPMVAVSVCLSLSGWLGRGQNHFSFCASR